MSVVAFQISPRTFPVSFLSGSISFQVSPRAFSVGPVSGSQSFGLRGVPRVNSFASSSAAFEEPGTSVRLEWSTTNATRVSIDNGVGSFDASVTSTTVAPSASTTYTLRAVNTDQATTFASSAIAKCRILVDLTGTETFYVVGTEILAAGKTIDPDTQQEFVVEMHSGSIVNGTVFASFSHYGQASGGTPAYTFHKDTLVYVRAHTDCLTGTIPEIRGGGGNGGYGSLLVDGKYKGTGGGGGGGAGDSGGTGGDSIYAPARNGGGGTSAEGEDGTLAEGGEGGTGSEYTGTESADSASGTVGLSGANAVFVSTGDTSSENRRKGNLRFDMTYSTGIRIHAGAGGGGGGEIEDPVLGDRTEGAGGAGGDMVSGSMNGEPGDLGTSLANAGLGFAGGVAGSAIYAPTADATWGFVDDDFGPSVLGLNTTDAGAVTE